VIRFFGLNQFRDPADSRGVNVIATKVYIDTHSEAVLDLRESTVVQNQLSPALVQGSVAGLEAQRTITQNRIRVAVADSQALFRDGLRKLLINEQDFDIVAETGTGAALIPLLENSRPDIVLLASPMEGESSQDLLNGIQRLHPEVKVIVLSAANDQDEFVKNVRAGARGIVQKSTSGSMLIKAIRKVQDGEFWLDRNTTAEVVRHFSDRSAAPVNPIREKAEARIPTLSRREREIVALVTQGFRNKELAEKLSISEQTVKNHMHNIFDKLGVSDRLELALYAIHHNWHGGE
jgi:two-component system nitrate/nitrite response regulator NarL